MSLRMLGYATGTVTGASEFGHVTTNFIMDDVSCLPIYLTGYTLIYLVCQLP